MAHLSLSLLGPFQAALDGQPVTGFESGKVRALLAYLAVEADRPHPRAVLAGLLWPDWPDQAALSNLRYALSNLRQAIGDRQASADEGAEYIPDVRPLFLLVTRDTIQFNTASDYTLDLTGLQDLSGLAVERLVQAVALYRDRFLEGFSCDSAPFEEWALFKREQIERQVLDALHRLAVYYEQHGEYEQAQSYARRQLELEPWDERAHQQLMRALALSGRRSAALVQYETCRRLLEQELGVEPAQETAALVASIRNGTLGRATGGPGDRERATAAIPPFLQEREQVGEKPRPVFVARERELARLARFLDLTLAGQGRVVFVTGDPGSGKTALVQEFVHRAMEMHGDLVVARGSGNAHTGLGDPYLPFVEALQMLAGDVEARWAGGSITREHARRLWNLLPTTAQALVDLGPDLLDRFVPGTALLGLALHHPASFSDLEADVSGRLAKLGLDAADPAVVAGLEAGQALDLDAVVAELAT